MTNNTCVKYIPIDSKLLGIRKNVYAQDKTLLYVNNVLQKYISLLYLEILTIVIRGFNRIPILIWKEIFSLLLISSFV